MRPNLDYANVIYHCANDNEVNAFEPESPFPILKQVESVQYGAAKIVSGAWHGTNTDKLYEMLGWESLNKRRIMRKLTMFHETLSLITKSPVYLHNIISKEHHTSRSRFSLSFFHPPLLTGKS